MIKMFFKKNIRVSLRFLMLLDVRFIKNEPKFSSLHLTYSNLYGILDRNAFNNRDLLTCRYVPVATDNSLKKNNKKQKALGRLIQPHSVTFIIRHFIQAITRDAYFFSLEGRVAGPHHSLSALTAILRATGGKMYSRNCS